MPSTILRNPEVRANPIIRSSTRLRHIFYSNSAVDGKYGLYDSDDPLFRIIANSGSLDSLPTREDGFVGASIRAYNGHHGLIIRPDDIWQAIVTQFSFYVTNNAEALRSKLVSHEGQKELVVYGGGTLLTGNYELLLQNILFRISENLKDSDITEWLLPNFTTTGQDDRLSAIVTVMATMQKYFSYKCCLLCGLPSVELLGTLEDWEELLRKVERLSEFDTDGHLKEWRAMLEPVIKEMIKTKKGINNIDWWQRIVNYIGGGSGPTYLSGWITVFSVFTEKGKWQGQRGSKEGLLGDWPVIETDDLPPSVISCPLTIDEDGTLYKTNLFAGQFCFDTVNETDIQIRNDWCLIASNSSDP